MPTPTPGPEVVAAGAVVIRRRSEVLLVHRPRYDDWSFAKGKLDPGEHVVDCAVREVEEETGLRIRLGPPLPDQTYPVAGGRTKRVHYWVGRVEGDDDVTAYQPNDEIDQVVWVPWEEAEQLLSYPRDRQTLAQAEPLRRKTRALVVLRHGHAQARKSWKGDDRKRPLARDGEEQARALVPLLTAYGVGVVASSSSLRCMQTVEPYAAARGWALQGFDGLSEQDATRESVGQVVRSLLSGPDAVLCGHRPTLPLVFDALGIPAVKLEPGGMLVAHHRHGEVLATEVYTPPV